MKLSILVTNYNYGHYLEEAVSSLFQNQSLDSFEVLLIDDGSTDESHSVIEKLIQKFPAIRCFKQQRNGGQEAALEVAFQHARGEYLHPFAADDVMLAGSIDRMLDYFKRYPEIPCFCSDNAYFFADRTGTIEIAKTIDTSLFHFFAPRAVYQLFAHTDFWIPGHTIFAKKEIYLQYTPFDKQLKFLNDWWVNHRMALKEGVGYIPEAISTQRRHHASFSASASLESKRGVWLYLFKLLEKNPIELQPLYRSGIFRSFGLRAIYKDLLKTPRYWKYLAPMCRKILEKKIADLLFLPRERFWLYISKFKK